MPPARPNKNLRWTGSRRAKNLSVTSDGLWPGTARSQARREVTFESKTW